MNSLFDWTILIGGTLINPMSLERGFSKINTSLPSDKRVTLEQFLELAWSDLIGVVLTTRHPPLKRKYLILDQVVSQAPTFLLSTSN